MPCTVQPKDKQISSQVMICHSVQHQFQVERTVLTAARGIQGIHFESSPLRSLLNDWP